MIIALFLACLLESCRPAPADPVWQSNPILGFYGVPASACSLVAAAGFTVVHTYDLQSSRMDSTTYSTAAQAYLDQAAQFGLKVLLGVPRDWLTSQDKASLRAAIRTLRRHSALLAWYEEEIAQHGDLAAVEFLNRVVQAEDPAHGLVIEESLQDERLLSIGRRRMFTYYPVSLAARKAGRLASPETRFQVDKLRVPFWPVLQSFGRDLVAGYPVPDIVAPTRFELQFCLYSALVAGARGIFFYPYNHPSSYEKEKVKAGAWAWTNYRPLPELSPELWRNVQATAADASLLLDLLQSARPVRELQVAESFPDLRLGQWRTPDGILVIAANPSYEARTIAIPANSVGTSCRHVLGGRLGLPQAMPGGILRLEIAGPGGAAALLISRTSSH